MLPFLPEDRVDDLEALEVVDHDRPTLGEHAPGEAAADRDADAALDLLFEPDRRASDELVAVSVNEQNGAGVDVQDRAYPLQELGERSSDDGVPWLGAAPHDPRHDAHGKQARSDERPPDHRHHGRQ